MNCALQDHASAWSVTHLLPRIQNQHGSHKFGQYSSRPVQSHRPGPAGESRALKSTRTTYHQRQINTDYSNNKSTTTSNDETWVRLCTMYHITGSYPPFSNICQLPALQAVTIKGRCTAMSMAVIAAAWLPIIAWHDAGSWTGRAYPVARWLMWRESHVGITLTVWSERW